MKSQEKPKKVARTWQTPEVTKQASVTDVEAATNVGGFEGGIYRLPS